MRKFAYITTTSLKSTMLNVLSSKLIELYAIGKLLNTFLIIKMYNMYIIMYVMQECITIYASVILYLWMIISSKVKKARMHNIIHSLVKLLER